MGDSYSMFQKKKNGGYTACSRKIKQSQENNSSNKTINGNNSVTIPSLSVSSTTNPKKGSENNSSNKNKYTKNPNDDYMCHFYMNIFI